MLKRTLEEALTYLRLWVRRIQPELAGPCHTVLADPGFTQGYGSSTGSPHSHHDYPGGLLVHTAEVLEGALGLLGEALGQFDLGVLVTSTVFHDYAKKWDYTPTGEGTPYKKFICHVAGSFGEWQRMNALVPVPLQIAVGHCILAHHGRKEWGSPIEPQTCEAQALHFADMMSMGYGPGRGKPPV